MVRRVSATGSKLFTDISRLAIDHALRWQKFGIERLIVIALRCQNVRTKWLVSVAIIRGLLVYIDGAMLVVVSGGVLPSRSGWYPLFIVSISDKFGQRRYNTHANVFVHLIVMARRLLDAGCQFFTYLPRLAIDRALRCQGFGVRRLGIIVSVCGLPVHINVAMLAVVSCSALRCRGGWEPLWIC
jgi:hypothetical protein